MKFSDKWLKIPFIILVVFAFSFSCSKKQQVVETPKPAGPEYGTVKDSLGKPVASASVYLVPASEQAVSCNQNRIEYYPPRAHIVRPPGERAFFVNGADSTIYLASIDEPLEYLVYMTPKPGKWQVTYTDPKGRFWFKDTKPGDYYMYVKPASKKHLMPGGSLCCGVTTVKGDEDTRKEITMLRNVSLEEVGKDWDFLFVDGNQKTPDGLYGIRAEDCGECHIEQYLEWKDSTHAQALQDAQYQAEISKPGSPKWVCLNCHTPIQNQRPYFIRGLVEGDYYRPIREVNPEYDPILERESISCAICHVRDGYIIGPYGSKVAAHPVKKDKSYLGDLCNYCHNVNDVLNPATVCCFDIGREMRSGEPFRKGENCVTCHMQSKRRPLMKGYPSRKGSAHWWAGSGAPKFFFGYDNMVERGYVPGLKITIKGITNVRPGKEAILKVHYKNVAGHYLLTGDPERFLQMEAALVDGSGKKVYKTINKIEQHWIWEPVSYKDIDNRMKPLEERVLKIKIPLPDNLNGLKLVYKGTHVRLTPGHADHMEGSVSNIREVYPLSTIFFMEEIDLKTKKRKKYPLKELMAISKKKVGVI